MNIPIATTLLPTTLLAAAAHGAICTFENLPMPSVPFGNGQQTGFLDGIGEHEGFLFTSRLTGLPPSEASLQGRWGYYTVIDGLEYGWLDEGVVGQHALFTPYGSGLDNNFKISRAELWRFLGLHVTAITGSPVTARIDGLRDGVGVFSYTATLTIGVPLIIDLTGQNAGPFVEPIDSLRISGFGSGNHLAIDNLRFEVVPAPSALALLGIAGASGIRKRR